jgi:hypothetical protein
MRRNLKCQGNTKEFERHCRRRLKQGNMWQNASRKKRNICYHGASAFGTKRSNSWPRRERQTKKKDLERRKRKRNMKSGHRRRMQEKKEMMKRGLERMHLEEKKRRKMKNLQERKREKLEEK